MALTLVWAGPHACQLLADWGAEVIRVESTQVLQPNTRHRARLRITKELARLRGGYGFSYPDWNPGDRPWNRYTTFQSHARNKLSMTVDLRQPEGREVFDQLLAISDVFVENNAPQTIEKLRLDYGELVKVRPDLIMVRMPAYGLKGPYKDYRSFGMQLESTTGHTWIRGYADMDPTLRDDTYMGDAAGGVNGALAVMLALRHRRRTGKGQLVEIAQAENFLPYLGATVMDYTMNGRVQSTLGNRHPSAAPQGVYRCQGEERWVTISVDGDEAWRGLCQAMGEPDWCREPKFATGLGRWKRQDELDRRIGEWTSERIANEVMHTLQAHGVAAGPVMDERDLYQDPHMEAQGYFQTLPHADAGTHSYPGLMWTMDETPNKLRLPPCRLGEHNEYVYNELLGVTGQDYKRLEEAGHIGMDYASHLA